MIPPKTIFAVSVIDTSTPAIVKSAQSCAWSSVTFTPAVNPILLPLLVTTPLSVMLPTVFTLNVFTFIVPRSKLAVSSSNVTAPPFVMITAAPKSLPALPNVMSFVVVAVPPASSVVVPATPHAPPWVIVLVVPPPVAIERLPARVSTPNVTLPASPSPAPLVTVRLSAVIAPIPLISALPTCETPAAPDESKIRFRSLPAFMVIAALIAISSPASKVRSKSPALPEASTSFVTVMSSWACSITLAVFKAVTRLVGEIVDVAAEASVNWSFASTA